MPSEREEVALVVIDMLNAYDHEDADELAKNVEPVVPRIRELIDRAGDAGVEVIYVNDNYGDWSASAADLAESACAGERPERRHVTGAMVFGVGWGVANACPGPILAHVGQGIGWGVFTFAGVIAGVHLYLRQGASETEPAADRAAPSPLSRTSSPTPS